MYSASVLLTYWTIALTRMRGCMPKAKVLFITSNQELVLKGWSLWRRKFLNGLKSQGFSSYSNYYNLCDPHCIIISAPPTSIVHKTTLFVFKGKSFTEATKRRRYLIFATKNIMNTTPQPLSYLKGIHAFIHTYVCFTHESHESSTVRTSSSATTIEKEIQEGLCTYNGNDCLLACTVRLNFLKLEQAQDWIKLDHPHRNVSTESSLVAVSLNKLEIDLRFFYDSGRKCPEKQQLILPWDFRVSNVDMVCL